MKKIILSFIFAFIVVSANSYGMYTTNVINMHAPSIRSVHSFACNQGPSLEHMLRMPVMTHASIPYYSGCHEAFDARRVPSGHVNHSFQKRFFKPFTAFAQFIDSTMERLIGNNMCSCGRARGHDLMPLNTNQSDSVPLAAQQENVLPVLPAVSANQTAQSDNQHDVHCSDTSDLCQLYDAFASPQFYIDYAATAQRLGQRTHAVMDMLQSGQQQSTEYYNISPQACDILGRYQIATKKITQYTGTILQHHIHQELISIIDASARLEHNFLEQPIMCCADIAFDFNREGNILEASRVADWCWYAIDCVKNISGMVYKGLSNGIQAIQYDIQHPIEAIKNFAYEMGDLACATVFLLSQGAELPDWPLLDQEAFDRYQREIQIWEPIVAGLFDHYSNTTAVEEGSRIIGDVIHDIARLKLFSTFFSFFKISLSNFKQVFKQACLPAQEVFAATAEGLQIAFTVKTLEEFGQSARMAQEIRCVSQAVEKSVAQEVGNLKKVLPAQVISAFEKINELCIPIESELPHIAKTFDLTRKATFADSNKFIKVPYRHILRPELNLSKGRLAGFHHDYLGVIEESGLIQFTNKMVDKYGVYSADLIWNGKTIEGKTFFPQHWTREQVIAKIYEGLDNFIMSHAQPINKSDGKLFFKTFISEGIEIELFMTQKYEITTAYPILRN